MHTIHKTRRFTLILLLFFFTLPLFAVPLKTLVDTALIQSSRMRDLELSKKNAELSLIANQAKEEVGITITTGNVTTDFNGSTTFSTSGATASFILPNEGKTTIQVSTGSAEIDAPYTSYLVNPALSLNHTFTYGYTADNRKSLLDRQTEILAKTTYESSKLAFITNLYTQIGDLLKNEKSIKTTEKEIEDLKRSLEQNLDLRLIREDGLVYQGQQQLIRVKQASLESLDSTRTLLLKQFTNTFGFIWEGVGAIDEPNLVFTVSPTGNSTVANEKLAWEVAKENRDLEKAKYTNTSLVVGGSIGVYSSDKTPTALNPTANQDKIKANAQATFTANQFEVKGTVAGTYNMVNQSFNPSLSVSGTWSNNPTSSVDMLNLQKLENDVLRAEISYNTALQDYLQKAFELESTIASWKLNYDLLKQSINYNKDVLKQQQTLFERGLVNKQAVDDAQFDVEMDAYTLQTTLLDGLRLENQIRTLQI